MRRDTLNDTGEFSATPAAVGSFADDSPILESDGGGSDLSFSSLASEEPIEYETFHTIEGIEDIQKYNKDGNHPVHIGDLLDGRFEVTHKLGNGGFGIVWFCRDKLLRKWRAVKVMTADHSASDTEEKILDYFRFEVKKETLEENNILVPLGMFWILGPNRRHLCYVYPVLGWTVDTWRIFQDVSEKRKGTKSKGICQQISKAIQFLHQNGICHGDLKPKNILMKIEGLDDLNEDQVYELMGEPEWAEIRTESGAAPAPRAPEYCVLAARPDWCAKLSVDHAMVTDFGEAFFVGKPPETTGIPNAYAVPEILFQGCEAPGTYSDIWSLACTIYEIRTSGPLFNCSFDQNVRDVAREMELYLGALPARYQDAWTREARKAGTSHSRNQAQPKDQDTELAKLSDKESEPMTRTADDLRIAKTRRIDGSGYSNILEATLGRKRYQHHVTASDDPSSVPEKVAEYKYPREEVLELGELLQQMLRYHPTERISIDSVILHPWISGGLQSLSYTEAEESLRFDRIVQTITRVLLMLLVAGSVMGLVLHALTVNRAECTLVIIQS